MAAHITQRNLTQDDLLLQTYVHERWRVTVAG